MSAFNIDIIAGSKEALENYFRTEGEFLPQMVKDVTFYLACRTFEEKAVKSNYINVGVHVRASGDTENPWGARLNLSVDPVRIW